jgi:L-ascorbate metabolism protein UlaG (beta-lactamase superfamily)
MRSARSAADDAEVASPRIGWLGHSTTVLDVDGVRVVTDPLLRQRVGPLLRRGPVPAPSAWAGVDAVLLSHLHHDHADLSSLRRLGGSRPVYTAPANARWLRSRGMRGMDTTLDRWHRLPGAEVEVTLVSAQHHARPMPHRPNEAHGHLLRSAGFVVWFAGDTSLYPEMATIPDTAGGPVDLAVVPIGGWAPRLSAGHLDPAQAARACALVGARYALPVHWGTLYLPGMRNRPRRWMDIPAEAFVEAIARVAPDCRPLVLPVGGSTTVPAAAS